MPESKKDKLKKILIELKSAGDVQGAAIVTRDGLLIAKDLEQGINAETFSAMAATMTGAAETAVSELKKGLVERVIAEAKDGKLISVGAGASVVLITLVGPRANIGLVLVEMGKAAKAIEKEMG